MSRGGTSVILRDMDPVELLRLVAAEGITHAFLVPAVLMLLLGTPGITQSDLSSLDTIFYGASPIAEDVLVHRFHSALPTPGRPGTGRRRSTPGR